MLLGVPVSLEQTSTCTHMDTRTGGPAAEASLEEKKRLWHTCSPSVKVSKTVVQQNRTRGHHRRAPCPPEVGYL